MKHWHSIKKAAAWLCRLGVAGLLLGLVGSVAAQDGRKPVEVVPLQFGLMPYLNTRTLIATYDPLLTFLQNDLQRPVQLLTAPDFDTFTSRVFRGDYDLVLLAPHYARLATVDYGYTPLVVHKQPIHCVLLTHRERPLKRLDELRGETVAVVDRSALLGIMAAQWFGEAGLAEQKDYRFVETTSHSSAVHLAVTGKARAAVVSQSTFKLIAKELQDDTAVFGECPSVPGQFIIAHGRLSAEQRAAIKASLYRFEKSAEGQAFFAKTLHGGYREPSRDDARQMDKVLPETRRLLKTSD